MKKLLVPLGLAAACFSPAPLWAQASLTLDQALELAIRHSPGLAAAATEVEAADGALQQAGLRRNPELTTSIEDLRTRSRTSTATLGLPLERGGKREARVRVAERARELAQADLALVRAELRARVIEAYFKLLVAQERSRLAADSVEIAQRARDAIRKRVAAGKASPVEDTRAAVDLANTRLEASEAVAEWQTQRYQLALLLGQGSPGFERVDAAVGSGPTRPALEALLAQLDDSPSLHSARLERERRIALAEVEQSKTVADWTLTVGAKKNNELGQTQAVLGLTVPLPVFDRNQGALREALRRSDKASDELDALRLRLMAELQEASNRLGMARQSLQTLKDIVLPAAQQTYEVASKGLEAGKFGFLEVLDAQRSLLQARARYLNTLASAYQAAAVIDRIVGR